MIRQDFGLLPPRAYLMQIANATVKVYVYLWDRKNKANRVKLLFADTNKFFNKNTLRTNLRRMCDVGLLSYEENSDGVSVELVDWDEADE